MAADSAFRERPRTTPFGIVTGRPPMKAVLEEHVEEWVDGCEDG